ncbi:MAG: hypothetical protein QXO40_00035 [Candidatus Aenigmatarchaeota archaeon]
MIERIEKYLKLMKIQEESINLLTDEEGNILKEVYLKKINNDIVFWSAEYSLLNTYRAYENLVEFKKAFIKNFKITLTKIDYERIINTLENFGNLDFLISFFEREREKIYISYEEIIEFFDKGWKLMYLAKNRNSSLLLEITDLYISQIKYQIIDEEGEEKILYCYPTGKIAKYPEKVYIKYYPFEKMLYLFEFTASGEPIPLRHPNVNGGDGRFCKGRYELSGFPSLNEIISLIENVNLTSAFIGKLQLISGYRKEFWFRLLKRYNILTKQEIKEYEAQQEEE